jgi:hypothetical protein
MCPVCVANIALIAAGTTSSGGLTALALGKLYKRKQTKQIGGSESETDGTRTKNETNEKSGNRITAGVGGRAPATAREGEGVDPRP